MPIVFDKKSKILRIVQVNMYSRDYLKSCSTTLKMKIGHVWFDCLSSS